MTGYFRLMLAFLVFLSHFQSSFGVQSGFNVGVFSVIIFYILAGHVVSNIYQHKLNGKLILYIKDRFLRIYPSYVYSLLVVSGFLWFADFGVQTWDICRVAANLLIIPLNYYMFIPECVNIVKVDGIDWNLIPPAWSLGAELQAYLLLPMLFYSRLMMTAAFLFSFVIFLLAKMLYVDPDVYGYRLLAGVMFVFITGAVINRLVTEKSSFRLRYAFSGFYLIFLLSFVFVVYRGSYGVYTLETYSGYLLGVVAVVLILTCGRTIPGNHVAGFLSYAVFLNHFTGIWIYKYLSGLFGFQHSMVFAFLFITAITLLVSIPAVLIDMFVYRYRKISG